MSDTIAAIDLGSNSFHMIVARMANGHLQIVDRLREMVQLAAGLDKKHRLAEEAQVRALECLARFGQRLHHLSRSRVRIVGTNTLRQARNGQDFLAKAEDVLGHPVEVVSGMEEARLIYLGVAHSVANVEGRRLVVDIGGGSTELIIGEQFESLYLESLGMGCVSMTQKYFSGERIQETELRDAELAVRLKMEPITLGYQALGWQHVIGASGTIRAIRDIVVAEGWSKKDISLPALQRLRAALLQESKTVNIVERWNLHPARAQVLTGGFTVLYGLCEALGVEHLQVSDGALREGLLYDLMGRIRHEDVRHRTIAALSHRYGIDSEQAERVTATCQNLLTQARTVWGLEGEEYGYALEWAARLHEIGLAIAHNQHHKHGAYVIAHADLPGFSRSEQGLLAALIRGQRRKFSPKIFTNLPKDTIVPAQCLGVLLRLAIVLHRSRSRQLLPDIALQIAGQQVALRFPPNWLNAHPLTRADLEVEAEHLQKAGFKLVIGQA